MAKRNAFENVAGISAAAVQAKTGRTWAEWIAILDAAGARTLTHKEIVAVLRDQHHVGSWWQQMVTNGYEQARQGRARHQMPDGYQVSANRTMAAPVSELFRKWRDARARARWLPEKGLTVTTATPDRSLRLRWSDGASLVSVNFYARGEARGQVVVEHRKLKDARGAARMKRFWAEALDRLKSVVEK
jgi:uncharacterized protein YndB with AHSA1/START domain